MSLDWSHWHRDIFIRIFREVKTSEDLHYGSADLAQHCSECVSKSSAPAMAYNDLRMVPNQFKRGATSLVVEAGDKKSTKNRHNMTR